MQTPRMVDITGKGEVVREATAVGSVRLRKETVERIKRGEVEKGDPCAVASIAAIMAAKNTPQIIPLCHPVRVTHVETQYELGESSLTARVKVKSLGKTGVEMEALTALSIYLLTVWDMVKAYEKDEAGQYPHTRIEGVYVESKVVEK
ncbi:MAG: cyclic pyranopterin monophosphate synthase MoaC [Candidatus Bathyarchaeia archaeon]